MLIDVFEEHNRKMKNLIGSEYSENTYIRYETSLSHIRKFLKYRYSADDIDVKKIDFSFIDEYGYWLKSERKCNHNSTIKYISNFKKIVLFSLKSGWIDRNPEFLSPFTWVDRQGRLNFRNDSYGRDKPIASLLLRKSSFE